MKTSGVARSYVKRASGYVLIEIERSGDWMPAEELKRAAMAALDEGLDVTIDFDGLDHLDASALQILLALNAEQKRLGRNLRLANASSHLQRWFEYSGATEHFVHCGA